MNASGSIKLAAAAALFWSLAPGAAMAAEGFFARLSGNEEAPNSNTSTASGFFFLNFGGVTLNNPYTLHYTGLEGEVTQAHIHIAPPGVAGPITIWLCQTVAAPAPPAIAANVPTCPGTTTGTVSAGGLNGINTSKVGALATQRIEAGNMQDILRALRGGSAYVNVHTTAVPGGEIRGQIR